MCVKDKDITLVPPLKHRHIVILGYADLSHDSRCPDWPAFLRCQWDSSKMFRISIISWGFFVILNPCISSRNKCRSCHNTWTSQQNCVLFSVFSLKSMLPAVCKVMIKSLIWSPVTGFAWCHVPVMLTVDYRNPRPVWFWQASNNSYKVNWF